MNIEVEEAWNKLIMEFFNDNIWHWLEGLKKTTGTSQVY
jgi:hypothetical protein